MRMLSIGLAALVLLGVAGAGETPQLDPAERRRAELELQRRRAQLKRLNDRLSGYRRELGDEPGSEGSERDAEPREAAVLVRSDTDRHGRAVYAVEADGATLRSVVAALAVEARLELIVGKGVAHRDVAALVSVSLEGVTLRGALDLLLGRFDLDYRIADGTLVVGTPASQSFETAANRLRRKAQLAYQAALVRFPDDPDAPRAHLLLGERFLARKLDPQAVEQLERLCREYRDADEVPRALLLLGEAYLALGDAAKAGERWRTIVASHPKSQLADDALLALARLAGADGKPTDALPLLQEIAGRYADGDRRAEAEVMLAETLFTVNHLDAALERFGRLLDQGLTPAAERHVRLLTGRALIAQGHLARAREALYALMQKFPASAEGAEAYYHLADTYFREKNYLAAIEAYRGALARGPGPLAPGRRPGGREAAPLARHARKRLAELYQRMTLYDLAIATYEALLAANPQADDRQEILHALGECHAERGSHQKAQLFFERAAKGVDPDACQAALRAGKAACADGRPADAVPFFERVTQQAKDKALAAEAFDALGDCYRRLARFEEALVAYETAARLASKPRESKEAPGNDTAKQ